MSGLFKVQLRAILRAATRFNVRIMFPMISSLEELRRAKELLAESQAELFNEGLDHNPEVPVGIMVEVPSAVWLPPRPAPERPFFSIGPKEPIHNLLPPDRNNTNIP